MKDVFFQWSKFFPPVICLQKFFLTRNQSAGIIFSEITHSPLPPQKSNGRPLSLDRLNWPEFCWVKNGLTIVDDNSNLCSVVVRSLYEPIGLSLAKPVTLFFLLSPLLCHMYKINPSLCSACFFMLCPSIYRVSWSGSKKGHYQSFAPVCLMTRHFMKLVFQPLFHSDKVFNAAQGNNDNKLNKLLTEANKAP